MIFNLLLPFFNFLHRRSTYRATPQTRAQIRSVYEYCSLGHEIGNLKDRDYFIWEVSLDVASDVINKWVKHIPSEVCLCRISFSSCPTLLVIRGG